MEEKIYLNILGLLCEPIGTFHEDKPKTTLRLKEVTCEKCIEIMKKQDILR